MIKNPIFWLLVIVFFAGCKKEGMQVSYNIIGTWTIYSASTPFPTQLDIKLAQYPCIANNVFTFSADGTAIANYIGTSPCNVTPPNANYIEDLGVPGQASIHSTWSISGNVVNFIYPSENNYKDQAVVTNVNGKMYLTFNDTFTYNSQVYSNTTVYLKQ
jgi:hypothetical protein